MDNRRMLRFLKMQHPRRYRKSVDLKRNTKVPENIRELLQISPDM